MNDELYDEQNCFENRFGDLILERWYDAIILSATSKRTDLRTLRPALMIVFIFSALTGWNSRLITTAAWNTNDGALKHTSNETASDNFFKTNVELRI